MVNYIKKIDATVKKSQILGAYTANGDWKALAREIGVSERTAYRWIQNGDIPDQRGGSRRKKVQVEHITFCVNQVEDNPRITLGSLQALLKAKYDLDVSLETIRTHLDGACYTLKDIRFEPESGNKEINKEKRKDFVCSLLNFQSQNLPILYMDETNFNIHISRKEGRSKKGTRATVVAAGSRGANVHCIGCISARGLVHYEIRRGSFKKENAHTWIKDCLRKAKDLYNGPVVLVIDNAPCHSKTEEIVEEPEFRGNFILRLGPYSPMLNPIESAWSVIKADVKRKMAEIMPDMLNGIGQGSLPCTEFRLRILEDIIVSSLNLITPTLSNNNIARIQSLFPSVLNKEDVSY